MQLVAGLAAERATQGSMQTAPQPKRLFADAAGTLPRMHELHLQAAEHTSENCRKVTLWSLFGLGRYMIVKEKLEIQLRYMSVGAEASK